MQVRGVVLVTIALSLGIAALILHILAMCSPQWKITKRDLPPTMAPVSYGLWQRCENVDTQIIKQGVTIGTRKNVQICWPNLYMRYPPEKFDICYSNRRSCPVLDKDHLPEGCTCRYLPSTQGLQWLTILAVAFIIFGLLLLYLKTIASAQNDSALLVLSYGPFLCFLLALALMITGLILVGAYLRRETYEENSFPLQTLANYTKAYSFDLHSLRIYAKRYEATFSHENYVKAEQELIADANTHYHTAIGRGTVYEICATALIVFVTVLSYWLGTASKSEDI